MTLRFGVIGSAYWAREIHLPGLLSVGADVAGLWGRTPETVQEIARAKGVRAFRSLDELLDSCDAVTIAVPPDVQAGIALKAAIAGKHLIAEKPLTRDSASARQIQAAVRDRDVAALVFYVRRFIPAIADTIARECDHPWTQANIRVHSAAMATPSPYAGSIWRQAPGAALWDVTPHVLSVLIAMMGPVVAVEAWPERDGVSLLKTWHERGGVAEISLTLHSAPDDTSNSYRFSSASREIVLPDPAFSRPEVFGRAVEALTSAVREHRRDLSCGMQLGVDAVAWIEKAEISKASGKKVV